MFHEDDLSTVCTALTAVRHRPGWDCGLGPHHSQVLHTLKFSSLSSSSQGPGKSLTLLLPVDTVDALQIGHGFAYLQSVQDQSGYLQGIFISLQVVSQLQEERYDIRMTFCPSLTPNHQALIATDPSFPLRGKFKDGNIFWQFLHLTAKYRSRKL